MKVVLDTNVLVSGTFWKGASDKISEFLRLEKLKYIISI